MAATALFRMPARKRQPEPRIRHVFSAKPREGEPGISVGTRLLYAGREYQHPVIFEVIGVYHGFKKAHDGNASVKTPKRDQVELAHKDDIRVLGARYLEVAALWALIED